LTISFNRFTYDYSQLEYGGDIQRIKITDRVAFPTLLNLNDYMKGYEGIENKLYEKEIERVMEYDKKTIEKNLKSEQ
jgi:hypothetical protein